MQDEHIYFNRLMELQALVASASTRFINITVDDTHSEIVSCLGSIAGFLEAEIASVNVFECPGGYMKNRYYWLAPHVTLPPLEEVDGNSFSQFRWTLDIVSRGECMLVFSRESIPPDAEAELQVFDMVGFKSVFHIPIFKEKSLMGLISFFTVTKPLFIDQEMIRLLRMLGEIFANLYARKEAERAVADSERHYREMADLVPVAIYEMAPGGRLTYVNRKGFELFGYTPADLARGLHCIDMLTTADREKGASMLAAVESLDGSPHAYEAVRKDGTTFPVLLYSIAILNDGALSGIRGAIVDLTEQKQAERKLMASLQEKEVLIKELHHRVKNNMQLVTSLFHLQISHVDNPMVRDILHVTGNRMKSIALVHEQCYRSSDFLHVDMVSFIRALGVQLKCTYPREKIEFTVQGEGLTLDMGKAIPLGIIANEILSNAFRHAFTEEECGLVYVEAETMDGGEWAVRFGDNGKGLPDSLDLASPATLGIRLIRDLAEQIDAELTVDGGQGTVYTLRIPV